MPPSEDRTLSPPPSSDRTPPRISCSTDDGLSPPPIYIASPDPLVPQSSPMGDPARRPPLDACMVHRSDEINAAEQALECALIVVVGGARSLVSTADVRL
jgi:hypothetical protein